MKRQQRSSHPGFRMVALIVTLGLAPAVLSASDSRHNLGQSRETIGQWVETRRLISQEKKDWKIGREMLQDRIELVQREIDSMRKKIGTAQESVSETSKKTTTLAEQRDALTAAAQSLEEAIATLEQRSAQLVRRLPPPAQERVAPLSQRLPKEGEETSLSLSARFMNVIGILNDINKFNREIVVKSELRDLPDGRQVEVTSMYLGIGQGYYVGVNSTVAGIGTASEDGWMWTPADDAAEAIALAIDILNNEEVASFVRLPVKIK